MASTRETVLPEDSEAEDDDEIDFLTKTINKTKKTKEQRGPRKRRRGKKEGPTASVVNGDVPIDVIMPSNPMSDMQHQYYLQQQQHRRHHKGPSFQNQPLPAQSQHLQPHQYHHYHQSQPARVYGGQKSTFKQPLQGDRRQAQAIPSHQTKHGSTITSPVSLAFLNEKSRDRSESMISEADQSVESEPSSTVSRSSFSSSMSDFSSAITSVIPALTSKHQSSLSLNSISSFDGASSSHSSHSSELVYNPSKDWFPSIATSQTIAVSAASQMTSKKDFQAPQYTPPRNQSQGSISSSANSKTKRGTSPPGLTIGTANPSIGGSAGWWNSTGHNESVLIGQTGEIHANFNGGFDPGVWSPGSALVSSTIANALPDSPTNVMSAISLRLQENSMLGDPNTHDRSRQAVTSSWTHGNAIFPHTNSDLLSFAAALPGNGQGIANDGSVPKPNGASATLFGLHSTASSKASSSGISSINTSMIGSETDALLIPGFHDQESSSQGQWLQLQYEWLLTKNRFVEEDEFQAEETERRKWSLWAVHAAEVERQRRIDLLKEIDADQDRERFLRRKWASEMIERERNERISDQFLSTLSSSHWFNETISAYSNDYELVCPYYRLGCRAKCRRSTLRAHLAECDFCLEMSSYLGDSANRITASKKGDAGPTPSSAHRKSQHLLTLSQDEMDEFEVMCPNAILGCKFSSNRKQLAAHLLRDCQFCGTTMQQQEEEREMLRRLVIEECEEERSRRVLVDGDLVARQLVSRRKRDRHNKGGSNIVRAEQSHNNSNGTSMVNNGYVSGSGEDVADIGSSEEETLEDMHRTNVAIARKLHDGDDMKLEFDTSLLDQGHTEQSSTSNDASPEAWRLSFVHGILQSQQQSVFAALHNEIQDNWDVYRAFQEKECGPIVRKLVQDLNDCVHELWPFSTIEIFGSYKTGIIGKSGDLDLVVYFSDEFKQILNLRGAIPLLHVLADHLERRGRSLIDIKSVLLHSRIPLIKATSRCVVPSLSGLQAKPVSWPDGMTDMQVHSVPLAIDISIDSPMHSGIATTELVLTLMHALPPLGPIALVLKEYLKSKQLSDAFTGGLPSYGLVLLLLLPVMQCARKELQHNHNQQSLQAHNLQHTALSESACPPAWSPTLASIPVRRRHSEHIPLSPPQWSSWTNAPTQPSSSNPEIVTNDGQSLVNGIADFTRDGTSEGNDSRPGVAGANVHSANHQLSGTVGHARRRRSGDGVSLGRGSNSARILEVNATSPQYQRDYSFPPQLLQQLGRQHSKYNQTPGRLTAVQKFARKLGTPVVHRFSTLSQQQEFGRKVALKLLLDDTARAFAVPSSAGTPDVPGTPEASEPRFQSVGSTYGAIIETFLESYCEGLVGGKHGFSMRDGGFRFDLTFADPAVPAHPQASDPLLIEDPVNVMNNVGKNCYRVTAVQRCFVEALERLKSIVVRHQSFHKAFRKAKTSVPLINATKQTMESNAESTLPSASTANSSSGSMTKISTKLDGNAEDDTPDRVDPATTICTTMPVSDFNPETVSESAENIESDIARVPEIVAEQESRQESLSILDPAAIDVLSTANQSMSCEASNQSGHRRPLLLCEIFQIY